MEEVTEMLVFCTNVEKWLKVFLLWYLGLTLKSASTLQLSVCIKTFLLMISAPSRPLSPSLHLIISPNIITYSEALKRQTIPWHSNIHQESASSLKNLIKHAQHKHTGTRTPTHTHKLIQLSEKHCPVVLTSFPQLSYRVSYQGARTRRCPLWKGLCLSIPRKT